MPATFCERSFVANTSVQSLRDTCSSSWQSPCITPKYAVMRAPVSDRDTAIEGKLWLVYHTTPYTHTTHSHHTTLTPHTTTLHSHTTTLHTHTTTLHTHTTTLHTHTTPHTTTPELVPQTRSNSLKRSVLHFRSMWRRMVIGMMALWGRGRDGRVWHHNVHVHTNMKP